MALNAIHDETATAISHFQKSGLTEFHERLERLAPVDDPDNPIARDHGKAAVGALQKHLGDGNDVGVGIHGNDRGRHIVGYAAAAVLIEAGASLTEAMRRFDTI